MVTRKLFERGDIIRMSFEPALGHEQQGENRPALVLSTKAFNRCGLVLVAPISQGGNFARIAGFAVSLSGSGMDVSGVVLVNHVKSLDLISRGARKIEVAPVEIVQETLMRLQAIAA
ncbi:type II toxin-antitoxin system ChpB family toxin [Enterobacteriaceae bacterium RIT711]|nr:type II toxin-antitoxin system ChpB family toxin [Enterobacteriaceae bacterium RIT711]